jgi:hypothetical protein
MRKVSGLRLSAAKQTESIALDRIDEPRPLGRNLGPLTVAKRPLAGSVGEPVRTDYGAATLQHETEYGTT